MDDKTITRVFVRMGNNYGQLFTSRFQDSPALIEAAKAEWAIDLNQFSLETIGVALNKMKEQYINYPPTLPQFIQICKMADANYITSPSTYVELPSPDISEEDVLNYRSFLRGAVGLSPAKPKDVKNDE